VRREMSRLPKEREYRQEGSDDGRKDVGGGRKKLRDEV
jgi:hypothetical protein